MLSSCPHRSDWSEFFLTVSSIQVPRCVLNFNCLAIFLHMEIFIRKASNPADILFLFTTSLLKSKLLHTEAGLLLPYFFQLLQMMAGDGASQFELQGFSRHSCLLPANRF